MTDVSHRTGIVSLGGIPHRLSVHEGLVTLTEQSGVGCTRINIRKCEPHGLLYVASCDRGDNPFIPACHIERATRIAEHFLGPNHFLSHADRHKFERNYAAKNMVRNWRMWRIYGLRWRLSCLRRMIGHQWRLWFPEPVPHIRWYEVPQQPQGSEAFA